MNIQKDRKKIIWSVCCFLGLFFLFCLRSPLDFGTSYLFCEDGMILYKEADEYGIMSLFHTSNGSMWFIQRVFGYVSLSIANLFNVVKLYPFFLSILTKIFESLCVFYFTSSRFEWIVQSKWMRLFIAASVLVAIPDTGMDVVNCDTSSTFISMFAVFLIGLNALRREGYDGVSVLEAVFLVLMALSSLGALFVLGVAILHLISYIIHSRNNDREAIARRRLPLVIIMSVLVLLATIIQLFFLALSNRTGGESLDLLDRLKGTLLYCVWFPYCNYYFVSCYLTIIGVLLWIVFALLLKARVLVVLYGAGFSSAWLFMCSLSCDYNQFFMPLFDINSRGINSRFWTLSYMIAAFFVGCAIYKLWTKTVVFKVLAIILLAAEIGILSWHYVIKGNGKEELYISAFNNNMALSDTNGSDKLYVPIGPFENPEPFGIYVAFNISDKAVIDNNITIRDKEVFSERPYHIGLIVDNNTTDGIKEAYIKYDNLDSFIGCYRSGVLDSSDGNVVTRLEFMSTGKLNNKDSFELYVLLDSGRVIKVK